MFSEKNHISPYLKETSYINVSADLTIIQSFFSQERSFDYFLIFSRLFDSNITYFSILF